MMTGNQQNGNAAPSQCLVQRVRALLGRNPHAWKDGSAGSPQSYDPRHAEAHVMEAVRRLAAGVAHDLNNLLLVVQGYTEMALADEDAGPQTLAHLAEVRAASVRAASLAEDLLTVGQRGRISPRMLQLNESISRALSSVRAQAADGVEVRLSLAPALPAVFSDDEQIARLVAALCARAWSAMPAGGRLTIGTQATEPDPSGQRHVLLTFADTGAPVPPDLRARLFEPFLPWKADSKGLGLELSIAYSIVHRLGGTIEVESPPLGGTQFVVSFPVRNEAPNAEDGPTQPSKETPALPLRATVDPVEPGQTILLAEDDEGLRTLAMKILSREGYEVLAARDGQEAVELFELNRDSVRLALIDEVMPRLGGRAALARMRRSVPGLPAILCTGYTWSLDGKTQESGDIFDILPKPWRPRELLRIVRETLETSRARLPGAGDDA
jgi:CheY-like chemotaxis protein